MTGYTPRPLDIALWREFLTAIAEQGLWAPPAGKTIEDVVAQTEWSPPRRWWINRAPANANLSGVRGDV